MKEAVALLLLASTLGFAVARPRGLPEAVVAVPAALLVVALGILPARDALDELGSLAPTIGFLAAMLIIGDLCDRDGLFAAGGQLIAQASRGRPSRLLALVFLLASAVTVVLSLDATVVLLTPVVFATAARLRVRARPHVYACVHLANSASLLLPVSNLTNLLAYRQSGVSFLGFAGVMALPWVIAVATEWLLLRRFFAAELGGHGTEAARVAAPLAPTYSVLILGLTLVGFGVTSLVGLDPAIAAAVGAALLAAPSLARRQITPGGLARSLNPPFLVFVAGLGVVVRAASSAGLAVQIGGIIPGGSSLPALLAIAGVAAVLANLVNNLPAILILLPIVAPHGTGPVLAALLGANIGPNLTYVGSLATLLWRASLRAPNAEPAVRDFIRLGLLTVPAGLVLSTTALWAVLLLR